MNRSKLLLGAAFAAATLGLAGCGGSSDASIGGNISGLAAGQSVVLQNNGGNSVTLSVNGTFSFPTKLSSGNGYNVTVLTQPASEVCQVANGAGTVDSAADAVTSVTIACVSTSTLGGTVSGLNPGTAVTLSNGSVLLPVATNGAFAFPGLLVVGTNYNVTIATQPAGETCAVANGVGTVTATGAPAITVTCS